MSKVLAQILRFKDQLRGVIKSPGDPQLNVLLEMAEMADSMKPRGKRIKQLTRDTSDIIAHTCRGLVDIANHLLLEGTDFCYTWMVLPRIQLKNVLGSYARVSSGTYFINAKSVIEKSAHPTCKACLAVRP